MKKCSNHHALPSQFLSLVVSQRGVIRYICRTAICLARAGNHKGMIVRPKPELLVRGSMQRARATLARGGEELL